MRRLGTTAITGVSSALLRSVIEGEMAEASPVADRRIDRRIVLQAAAAMAAAGLAVLLGGHAEAQPRAGGATALATTALRARHPFSKRARPAPTLICTRLDA